MIEQYDLIIFGCTVLAGSLCPKWMVEHYILNNNNKKYNFGLATRSSTKLKSLLLELILIDKSSEELIQSSITLIECDAYNTPEIEAMVRYFLPSISPTSNPTTFDFIPEPFNTSLNLTDNGLIYLILDWYIISGCIYINWYLYSQIIR